MKKNKLICVLLTLVLAFVLLFALAACNPQEEHQHTYSENWTTSDTHHWHAATCGHDTFKGDYATHNFQNYTDNGDGTCTATCVCGKTDTHNHVKPDDYAPTAEGHGFDCKNCGATVSGAHDSNGYHYTNDGHIAACSVCGYYDTTAQLTGHTLSENWADEDNDGVYTKVCVCGYHTEHGASDHNYTVNVTATDYVPARTVQAKVCADDNTKHIKTCTICGHTDGEATAHNLEYVENNGEWQNHDVYCTACNYLVENEEHEYEQEDGHDKVYFEGASMYGELGHHWKKCVHCEGGEHIIRGFEDNAQQGITATLSYHSNGDGTHYYACNGCAYRSKDIACNGNAVDKDDIYHWNICSDCEGTFNKVHHNYTWNENEGTCSTCGKTITHTANDHVWSTDYADDGENHYIYCLICNAHKDGSEAAHTESSTATKFHNGKHYTECTGCHKPMTVDENSEHNFEDNVCSVCGASKYVINLKVKNGEQVTALTALTTFKLYNGNVEITDCGITHNNGVVTVVFVPETGVATYKLYHGALTAGYCITETVDEFEQTTDTNYYEFSNIDEAAHSVDITFATKEGMKDNPYNLDIVTSEGEVTEIGALSTNNYTAETWFKFEVESLTSGGNYKFYVLDNNTNFMNNNSFTVYKADKTTVAVESKTINEAITKFKVNEAGVYYIKITVSKNSDIEVKLYPYYAPLANFTPTTTDNPEEKTLTDSNNTASVTVVNNYGGATTGYDYITVTFNLSVGGLATISFGDGFVDDGSYYFYTTANTGFTGITQSPNIRNKSTKTVDVENGTILYIAACHNTEDSQSVVLNISYTAYTPVQHTVTIMQGEQVYVTETLNVTISDGNGFADTKQTVDGIATFTVLPANYTVTITGFAADSAYEYKNDCTITKSANGADVIARVVKKMLDLGVTPGGNAGNAPDIADKITFGNDYRFKNGNRALTLKYVATEAGWYTFEINAVEGCAEAAIAGFKYSSADGTTYSQEAIVTAGVIATTAVITATGASVGATVGTMGAVRTVTLYLNVGDTAFITAKAVNSSGAAVQSPANTATMTIKVTQDKDTPKPTV